MSILRDGTLPQGLDITPCPVTNWARVDLLEEEEEEEEEAAAAEEEEEEGEGQAATSAEEETRIVSLNLNKVVFRLSPLALGKHLLQV